MEEMITIEGWRKYGTLSPDYNFAAWDTGDEIAEMKPVVMSFQIVRNSSCEFGLIGNTGFKLKPEWNHDMTKIWFVIDVVKRLLLTETPSALLLLEVTHGPRPKTRDTNFCYDGIINLQRKYMYATQSHLEYPMLCHDGYVLGPDTSKTLFLNARIYKLRMKGLAMYLPRVERAHLMFFHGDNAAKIIKAVCKKMLVSFENSKLKSVAVIWDQLTDKKSKREASKPVGLDIILQRTNNAFPYGDFALFCTIYPLVMELLQFGLIGLKGNTPVSCNEYALAKPAQMLGNDKKPVPEKDLDGNEVCDEAGNVVYVMGTSLISSFDAFIHGKINSKLELYRAWVKSNSTGDQMEMEKCGFLAIQLIVLYYYLDLADMMCDDYKPKKSTNNESRTIPNPDRKVPSQETLHEDKPMEKNPADENTEKKSSTIINQNLKVPSQGTLHEDQAEGNQPADDITKQKGTDKLHEVESSKIHNQGPSQVADKQPLDDIDALEDEDTVNRFVGDQLVSIDDGLVPWEGPPITGDIAKVDCDGAFTAPVYHPLPKDAPPHWQPKIKWSGKAGYSTIIRVRDEERELKIRVLIAVAHGAEPVSSVYHELQGLKCGFQHAKTQGEKHILISSDCKQAIYAIEKGISRSRAFCKKNKIIAKKLDTLVNQIITLKGLEGFDYDIIHQFRGANEPANWLAAKFRDSPDAHKNYTQEQIDNDEDLRVLKRLTENDASGTRYRPEGLPNYDGL